MSPAGGGTPNDLRNNCRRGWTEENKTIMQDEFDNLNYNKHLQPNANKLRKEMTKAEACLWKYVLKGKMMMGYQFRRQRPVLKYIADFMCKELMLVIETDGITHMDEKVYKKDLQKDHDLQDAGFSVLRFNDEDVLNNIEWVRITIEEWIKKKIKTSLSTPSTTRS
jgi:very-short-patch-repair endonuclease